MNLLGLFLKIRVRRVSFITDAPPFHSPIKFIPQTHSSVTRCLDVRKFGDNPKLSISHAAYLKKSEWQPQINMLVSKEAGSARVIGWGAGMADRRGTTGASQVTFVLIKALVLLRSR